MKCGRSLSVSFPLSSPLSLLLSPLPSPLLLSPLPSPSSSLLLPLPSSPPLLPLSPHLHSLPPYIVVPYNISDDTLEYVASLHSDNRLPVRLLLSTCTKYFHTENIFYFYH